MLRKYYEFIKLISFAKIVNLSPEFNNKSIFMHSVSDARRCKETENELIYIPSPHGSKHSI
jgi:hypothetical protein